MTAADNIGGGTLILGANAALGTGTVNIDGGQAGTVTTVLPQLNVPVAVASVVNLQSTVAITNYIAFNTGLNALTVLSAPTTAP